MRIDTANIVQLKTEVAELTKNVEAGDVIKGKVLEAIGNSITLRTASGQILTAILQEGIKLPRGAFIEMLVNSVVDGKIYAELRTDSKDINMDMKLAELLKQLNLPVDETYIDAAKLLIKYKLPVDRESITNITGLHKSIENLSQSSDGRVALLLSGLDIKNTPVDVLNKVILSWPEDLNGNKTDGTVEGQQGNTAVPAGSEKDMQKFADTAVKAMSQETAEEANNTEHMVSSKEMPDTVKPDGTDVKKAAAITVEQENVTAPIKNEGTADLSSNKGADLLKALDKFGIQADSKIAMFAERVTDILASIRGADMEALAFMVSKDMEITPKNLGMLIRNMEGSDGISQLLDIIQQRTENEDKPELKEIGEAIKRVFINPQEIEDSKEVLEKLKDIARLSEKLEGYMNRNDNKDPELRIALSNLRDNIDFIRNINQHANFIHIPVMINGNASTAKLYVFKDGKRSRQINPEDATIVVALDLRSLGHLESMIKVKDKTVSVTFRVENKSIGSIIEKHGALLKKSLKDKGYSLNTVRVINLEQPFSVISLEAMMSESCSDKIHFDMRV